MRPASGSVLHHRTHLLLQALRPCPNGLMPFRIYVLSLYDARKMPPLVRLPLSTSPASGGLLDLDRKSLPLDQDALPLGFRVPKGVPVARQLVVELQRAPRQRNDGLDIPLVKVFARLLGAQL